LAAASYERRLKQAGVRDARTERHAGDDPIAPLLEAYRGRGDRRAVERILSLNARILSNIARRYSVTAGEPYEDLLQVGYVGLMKAIKNYKVRPEARFSTYAYSMIEGEIRHHLRDAGLVKRPRWARGLYSKVLEATNRLTNELGRPPQDEEVAREVNVAPKGLAELRKLFGDTDVFSLDKGEGEIEVSAIKSLHHESFSLPIEDRIQLERALGSLSEIQRNVLYLFFYKDLTQTEIGMRLGLSQRKTSRTVASALKVLRESKVMESPDGARERGLG
jgi:RNA polymerase sigma factor (sigma-70 family)